MSAGDLVALEPHADPLIRFRSLDETLAVGTP